jgi:D-glycero-D-manno-heptose 1,7-bisphosphate phosphatase
MKKNKVAFLDRDGVINKANINNGYIGRIKDFVLMNGAINAIKYLKKNNYKVIVVSNQSGIARGYFKFRDVQKIHIHLQKKLKKKDTKIDAFYFCPYHVDGIIKKYKKKSNLRKPDNGMFKLAKKRFMIDVKNSFMVGDQITDRLFANRSNLKYFMFNEKNLYNFIKKKLIKLS